MGLCFTFFSLTSSNNPANGSYPSFLQEETGTEKMCVESTPSTVWGLQYQELRMGLWAEERTGMEAEGLPRGSLGMTT